VSRIELAPEVREDFGRIVDHLDQHLVDNAAARIHEIVEAIGVLLQQIRRAICAGGTAWVAKAVRRQEGDSARFDRMSGQYRLDRFLDRLLGMKADDPIRCAGIGRQATNDLAVVAGLAQQGGCVVSGRVHTRCLAALPARPAYWEFRTVGRTFRCSSPRHLPE